MSMNRIGGQPPLPSRTLDPASQSMVRQGALKRSNAYGDDGAAQRAPVTEDRAEISEKAHQLMEMRQAYETGLAAVGREPDIREEKLAEVRSRLAEGFYESQPVRDKVSEGVLRTLAGTEEA